MNYSRVDHTYREIRQRIVNGVYLPAERLIEESMAQSLGVSRISVRSAFQRLHQDGLITLEPRRGARVTVISLEEALEIIELREGLEGWAARLAARRISEEAIQSLEQLIAEMMRVVREGTLLQYADLNSMFHQRIAEAAGNRRLRQMMDGLKVPIVTYQFRIIFLSGRKERSIQEHTEIVAALRSRCEERAESVMRSHISVVRRTIAENRNLIGPRLPAFS